MYKPFALPAILAVFVLGFSAAPASAQDNRQATFGNLIAALNNINVQIENLEIIDDINIGDITVIDASNLLRGANIRALNNALNRNVVQILNLQDVLNDNVVIVDALNDLDIDIGQVVAIDVNLLSGEINIFFFD